MPNGGTSGPVALITCKPGVRTPPAADFGDRLFPFVETLVCLVEQLGEPVVVTSWYRTPEDNQRVGGNPESLHLQGLAVDLRLGDGATNVAAMWLDAGLDAVQETDHWHLEWDGPGTIG